VPDSVIASIGCNAKSVIYLQMGDCKPFWAMVALKCPSQQQ